MGALQAPLDSQAKASTSNLDPAGRPVIRQINGDMLAITSQFTFPAEALYNEIPKVLCGGVIVTAIDDVEFALTLTCFGAKRVIM